LYQFKLDRQQHRQMAGAAFTIPMRPPNKTRAAIVVIRNGLGMECSVFGQLLHGRYSIHGKRIDANGPDGCYLRRLASVWLASLAYELLKAFSLAGSEARKKRFPGSWIR
jgi:hypothetical protein